MPRFDYSEVRSKIKETATVFWYDQDGKLLITGLSKNKTKKQMRKKNYDGKLYRLSISFHTGKKKFQGGTMAIRCNLFEKEGKELNKLKNSKKNGILWVDKDWIESVGWDKDDMDTIIKKLKGRLEISFGIYNYES